MDSNFPNLFFHLFEVNPISKRGHECGLISLTREKIRSYVSIWKVGNISKSINSWLIPFRIWAITSFVSLLFPLLLWMSIINGGCDFILQTTSSPKIKITLSCMMLSQMRRKIRQTHNFPSMTWRYIVEISPKQNMLIRGGNFL